MSFIKWLIDWLVSFFQGEPKQHDGTPEKPPSATSTPAAGPAAPAGPRFKWERVEDRPDQLAKGVVYLIGDTAKPWRAAMVCPCGCGASIDLSLVPKDDPTWRATIGPSGQISLHPSVWRTKGCRAHFILREGVVHWARP